jgi:MFS family permease
MAGLAWAESMTLVNLSCLAVGLCFGLYLPSAIATITTLAPSGQFGRVLAVHESASNLAFLLAPLIAELMVGLASWRAAPLAMALLCLILGLAFIPWGRGGRFKGKPLNLKIAAELASRPALWVGGLVFFLGVSTASGCFSMLPLYLVFEQHIGNSTVNLLLALSRLSCLGTAFLAGVLSDRLGAFKTLLLFVGLTGCATVFMGLTQGTWMWVWLFVQAGCTVCIFPPAYAYLAHGFDPNVRNLAVSLASALGLLTGNGLVPVFLGYMGESGYFAAGFALVGGLLLLMLPVLFLMEKRQLAGHQRPRP